MYKRQAQSADFGEEEWADLRLSFLPGAAVCEVSHDLRRIWNALGEDAFERVDARYDTLHSVLVWREGERSTFMMGSAEEVRAFHAAQSGLPYAEICMMLAGKEPSDEQAHYAAMRAGALLGRWLNEGLIASIST